MLKLNQFSGKNLISLHKVIYSKVNSPTIYSENIWKKNYAEIRNLPQLNEIYDYCQNLKFEETPQYGLKIGGPFGGPSAVRQLQEFHVRVFHQRGIQT